MSHYTQRAEWVFRFAKDAAKEYSHAEVYPAHILLGLFQEGYGISAQILKNHGFSAEKIKSAIASYNFGMLKIPVPDLPWTEAAQFVSREASAEAQAIGHNYVGTEHLLLSMTRLPPHQWLNIVSSGDIQDIRRGLLSLLGHGPEELTRAQILARVLAIRNVTDKLIQDLRDA